MNNILYAITENTKEGLIIGGKLIAAIIIAALVLYAVLIITRVGGKKINIYLYNRYRKKHTQKNGNDCIIMSFEEFLKSKSNTKIIENPQNQLNNIDTNIKDNTIENINTSNPSTENDNPNGTDVENKE